MGRSISASTSSGSTTVSRLTPLTGIFGSGNIVLIPTNRTFTVPASSVRVRCWGPGPNGGHGGGFAMKTITGLTVGSTVSVTVGMGGSGTTTSFGAHCSATAGTSSTRGTGVGGDVNYQGGLSNGSGGGGAANLFGDGGSGGAGGNSPESGGSGASGGGGGKSTGGLSAAPGGSAPTGSGGVGSTESSSSPYFPALGMPPVTNYGADLPIDFIGAGPGGGGGRTYNCNSCGQSGVNGGGGGGAGNAPGGSGGFPGGAGGWSDGGTAMCGRGAHGLVIVEY